MSRRTAGRLAWSGLAAYVILAGAGLALLAQVPAAFLERTDNSVALEATFVAVLLVFTAVGAVVASRLPANPIGWLFLGLGVIEGFRELAYAYAHHALHVDGSPLAAGDVAAWLASWLSPLTAVVIALALLLFPNGHPPSPRWWALAWMCPVAAVVMFVTAFAPGPLGEFADVENPLGVEAAAVLRELDSNALPAVVVVAAVASLVVRYRRSHGVVRQQLKWIAFAAALMAALLLVTGVSELLGLLPEGRGGETAAGFVFALFLSGLPVGAGVAILRHRLYDIDVVINRALVYGTLTATLVGAYVGVVLLLQFVLSQDSGLAVAGSTLATAALFRPARARIQALVDHRFYRRRYDAAHTLEAFGGRLREELDLDALGADLRAVTRETLQPAHVSLWLRRTS